MVNHWIDFSINLFSLCILCVCIYDLQHQQNYVNYTVAAETNTGIGRRARDAKRASYQPSVLRHEAGTAHRRLASH